MRSVPAQPQKVHRAVIAWARERAYGHRNARIRAELVAAMADRLEEAGFERLAAARDLDAEVRKVVREARGMGYPILSCADGYYYCNPMDWKDLALYRWHMVRRALSCLREVREARFAVADEAKRLAGESPPAQLGLPQQPRSPIRVFLDEAGQANWC